MTAPFFGLDIASRALQTQQTLVDITNQNIANANTPGYSRQTATVTATAAYPIPVFSANGQPGQLGTGVQVSEITRARDTFLDAQVRTQLASQGNWDAQKTTLGNVESILNEPSTSGLSSTLTSYFSAWQTVANNPADPSARASVIEQGKAVATGFNSLVSQLQTQQRALDQQVGGTVANINDYASQIASINKQIAQVETTGMHANDLRDQRDQLLDKLSSLVKVTSVESANGEVSVFVGGHQLVDRDTTTQMRAVAAAGQPFTQAQWSDGSAVSPGSGQLAGQLTARDSLVQSRIDGLNQLAGRVIKQVNALHQSGVDLNGNPGVPFFTGSDATTIAVSSQLSGPAGTDYVAAAREYQASAGPPPTFTYAKGDSSNAVALGELANSRASVDTTTGLGTNPTVGSMSVSGISVNGAAASTKYAFSWDATNNVLQVTSTPNGSTTAVTATIQPGAGGSNQVMTVDGSGVRLTVNVPNGTSLQTALQGMAGQSVSTAADPSTISNQYSQFVAALGVDSNTAQGQSANAAVLVNQLQTQQQSVSGVSIDEETTHLIQYQRAYQAAAHVVSVMDSMLDTLINHTT